MPTIHNQSRKGQLALALASGATAADWAKENNVPGRTAYRWSRCPEVIDEVEAIRRAALERAIGRLSGRVTEAAEQILALARDAASESVRLQAARAVLADLMSVSSFAALERRMAQIERRIQESCQLPVAGCQPDQTVPTGNWQLGTGNSEQEDGSCPAC
jgi:hypothetical protein